MSILGIKKSKAGTKAEAHPASVRHASPPPDEKKSARELAQADQPVARQVRDPEEIYQKVHESVEQQAAVQVFIGNGRESYVSQFALLSGETDYLQERTRLLIAPLEPQYGNVQMAETPSVQLRFFHSRVAISCQLTYQCMTEDGMVQLSYPEELQLEESKRAAVRVEIGRDWDIKVLLRSASRQEPVSCKLFDLSIGGASFYSLRPLPFAITDGMTVFLNLGYPEVPRGFDVQGVTTGSFHKRGIQCYRVRFVLDVVLLAQQVERMVAWSQRYALQLRRNAQEMAEEKRRERLAESAKKPTSGSPGT
jgi:hypothetical protein